MEKKGIVYLVGAGPGDAQLLTLKGEKRLKTCEVLVYDRLASEDFLELIPPECEKIYVGKVVGNHSFRQEDINEIIVKKALEGKRVVRLKGGDPFVFGRGGEEINSLTEAGIAYEVIPGITSAIAAAAYAGIPVTHRGISRSFHVITGHTMEGDESVPDFENLAKIEGTLIFLMGMSNLDQITKSLMEHGKDGNTPVALVSNGTTKDQRVVKGTLINIVSVAKEKQIKAPAIIIIGYVVELEMKDGNRGLLNNIRIGINGTKRFRNKLGQALQEEDGEISHLFGLELEDYTNRDSFVNEINRLNKYSWLILTSSNGVEIFFERLKKMGIDFRILSHLKIAVIGEGTKETILSYGFIPDYMPEVFTAEALGKGLKAYLSSEDSLLIARALHGSKLLTEIFEKENIEYTDLGIYDLVEGTVASTEQIKKLDYITFGSSSGVETFFKYWTLEDLNGYPKLKLVSIGAVTSETLQNYGVKSFITAEEASIKSLVSCILKDVSRD